MIISAEYENGAIKLWPAPDPMEGKRIAQEILDTSPRDVLVKEIEDLDFDLSEVRDELSDLRLDFRQAERDLRALLKLDASEIKEALQKVLEKRFGV